MAQHAHVSKGAPFSTALEDDHEGHPQCAGRQDAARSGGARHFGGRVARPVCSLAGARPPGAGWGPSRQVEKPVCACTATGTRKREGRAWRLQTPRQARLPTGGGGARRVAVARGCARPRWGSSARLWRRVARRRAAPRPQTCTPRARACGRGYFRVRRAAWQQALGVPQQVGSRCGSWLRRRRRTAPPVRPPWPSDAGRELRKKRSGGRLMGNGGKTQLCICDSRVAQSAQQPLGAAAVQARPSRG
jgi:hypothetical protein